MNIRQTMGLVGIVATLAGCEPAEQANSVASAKSAEIGIDTTGTFVAPRDCEYIMSANYNKEWSDNYTSKYNLSITCPDSSGNVMVYRLDTSDPNPQWYGVKVIIPKSTTARPSTTAPTVPWTR